MTSQSDKSIKIELTIRAEQPELLEGLDLWLHLGLLSDAQVRRICRTYLVCPLPAATATEDFITEPTLVAPVESRRVERGGRQGRQGGTRHSSTPLISRVLSSLMAEISVVWLLFLGVFMVVVSSGVLAATQWQNFSPVGQYAILFGYTLAFWIASLSTRQQQNLHLTSRMLQIATLLIIPVNFWMIDGFNLWRSGWGWMLGAIAAISLSAIAWMLLQPIPRLLLFNSLGLSWLQWGWALPGFPLLATYIGTVGTAILIFHQFEIRGERREALGNGSIAIAFSSLLLIGRAALRAGVPLNQLGLALGVCGWLLCWLTRRQAQPPLTQAGTGLLIVGWLVAVTANPPWQAIAVSGLGIWLLVDRLKRLWQFQDLLAIFLLGLQAYCLLWWLIPFEGRSKIIALATQLAGGDLLPGELIGLAIFPYIVATVLLAFRLRHWQQPTLANYTERIAFSLGIVLALISLFHPLVRSLYLLVSTLTLAIVLVKRPNPGAWLIYLTHITGLLTLFAWIGWGFPILNARTWAVILLVVMVVEWSLNRVAANLLWQRSAWHLGLALATFSYVLLLSAKEQNFYWGLIWLVTPTFLTWLASRPTFSQTFLASWLSVTALLLAQVLTIGGVTSLLISLGVATALMLVNTQQLQLLPAAVLTVGFGLSFILTGVWQIWGEIPANWLPTWIAIALWGLWLLRYWANNLHTPLSRIYASALDGWAIALSILNLSILTLYVFYLFLPIRSIAGAASITLAAVFSTGAMTFHNWQQPRNLSFYGIAWGTELVVAGVVLLTKASSADLAIANLSLGLVIQLGGDWWVYRSSSPYRSSWHAIPIIYAALGLVLAHNKFTAITGIYTLAAALTGVGVGRRQPDLKPLTYLSIFGFSTAAYELLIYQLLQASGGMGDGIVLLAMLAAAIVIAYRLLSRWLLPYWRVSPQELLGIAHFHWAGGSLLSLLALWTLLSNTGSTIWIGVTAVLAAYAIWQGRSRENWIYVGVFEGLAALGYLLYRILPESTFFSWIAVIACLVAYALYTLPWRAWGWSTRPWQQSAAIVPASIVQLTFWGIAIQSLLIVAGFYAWLAKAENRIRLSYLSIFLADWAIFRLLFEWSVSAPLWYMSVLSGSLLYVAQVDPALRSPSEKEKRHILRTLATGLFCLTALYQSDPSLWQGFLTIALGFGLILAGLTLRVRAFLYLGTATFMLKVLRQLWLFINNYSLLLWALGIVVGLLFIWIAANFEARRSQAIALVQYWIQELETWE